MNITLLIGAYKNAGDFLIADRSKKILQDVYSDCKITTYLRNEKLDKYLDEINKSDVIILAGGPGYHQRIYPNQFKLTNDLNDIKPKMMTLGMGWYGKSKLDQLDDYLFELEQSNYLMLENAFHSMHSYYQVMREHISSIQDKI